MPSNPIYARNTSAAPLMIPSNPVSGNLRISGLYGAGEINPIIIMSSRPNIEIIAQKLLNFAENLIQERSINVMNAITPSATRCICPPKSATKYPAKASATVAENNGQPINTIHSTRNGINPSPNAFLV